MPIREFTAPEDSRGHRLDQFVAESLGLSRGTARALLEAGAVRVGGRRAKKGQPLEPGQRVTVDTELLGRAPVPEPELPLRVLHEDEALLFLDKSAGLPSHPLRPKERGTVANALVARYPECVAASVDPREAGLCHRLDIETSGVLLAARNRAAWTKMRDAFSPRHGVSTVDKRYWALTTGPIADEGEIDLPLRHAGGRAERVEPVPGGGPGARQAKSLFWVLARSGEYSLVEVRIVTGVLHQVRAHLAAIGSPIVGDSLYGGSPQMGLGRFFLHARSLEVPHPQTGRPLRVESPLPQELAEALTAVGIAPPAAP